MNARELLIPAFLVFAGFIVVVSIGVLLWSNVRAVGRRARERSSTCRCGYDWTGLPADAKCPECGGIRILVSEEERQASRRLICEGIVAAAMAMIAVLVTHIVVVREVGIMPMLVVSLAVLWLPGVAVRLNMRFRRRTVSFLASIAGQMVIVGSYVGSWYLCTLENDGPIPIGTLLFVAVPAITLMYGGMAGYLLRSELAD